MIVPARQAFIESGFREAFAQVVDAAPFKAALGAALLALTEDLEKSNHPALDANHYNQIVGARKLATILQTIHNIPEEKPERPAQGLRYEVPGERRPKLPSLTRPKSKE